MAARRLFLLDSIAYISPEHEDQVIVSGSHGGASAASFVVKVPKRPLAVFYNDAGGGKDDAGIVALGMLESLGVICATYSHLSARIGEARDGFECGVITHLNPRAATAGLALGMPVRDAVRLLGADTPDPG